MIDEDVRATASFNDDTAEGHVYRRRLYHTDRNLYHRLNNPFNNNEMERYYYDRQLGRFETVRPTLNQEEVIRRINGGGTDIRLFQTTTVTTVNPKWWMKIKIVLQESWLYDPIGVVVVSTLATIVTIIGIAKILSVW
jgi:hypothetical protein